MTNKVKKLTVIVLGLLLLASVSGLAQAADKPTIRVVTAWSQKAVEHYGFFLFLDEHKKKLGDRVNIKYLGGSEVIGYFDQYEMLGKGTFELGHLPGNLARNVLPIANALHLHDMPPWEVRKNPGYEIIKKGFEEKMNIVLLGTTAGKNYKYVLYSNFEPTSLAAFKGKTFRVAPVYIPLLTSLGAGSVAMPPGEVYTAMDRGVVNGFGWPTIGPMDFGWWEVTKYRINPPFYPVDVNIYFNKDAFYKLPKDIQDTIHETVQEVERKAYEEYGRKVAKEEEQLQAKGMKFVDLPPAEGEKFLKAALEEGWKEVIKGDPENGKKLQELFSGK